MEAIAATWDSERFTVKDLKVMKLKNKLNLQNVYYYVIGLREWNNGFCIII